MFTDMDYELEEDKLGIPTVPGTVCLKKDANNLIGISIGGGAQYCPCLYIVQVFDNTPAALEGTLAAGDEITGVNGKPVKGKTKVEVAKMIQAVQCKYYMNFSICTMMQEQFVHWRSNNPLQQTAGRPKTGKSLDIVLKKVKHRLVENMSSGTADALGLSRAILCNDGLVKRLEELEKTAELYKGLMEHTKRLLRAFLSFLRLTEVGDTDQTFGDVFSVIGVREPQAAASEAFVKFADAHRSIEKYGIQLLKTIKPMLHDLNTYLHKAIPDTKLTIRKYLDVKFEYLSYCLKVKEMDDEEYSSIAMGEPLYRVSTGNYEYRLVLRCRQEARARFAKMRKDVLEKIELLDQKHVQDIVFQLQRFVSGMSHYYDECYAVLKEADVFPIEVDLSRTMINYSSQSLSYTEDEEEEEDGRGGEEGGSSTGRQAENGAEKLIDDHCALTLTQKHTHSLTELYHAVFCLCLDSLSEMTTATVYWDSQHKMVLLKEGVLETEGDAYGYLNNTLSSSGWSILEVRAGYGKTPETDEVTFFLAGYLEGFLTAQQMMDHYTNMYPQLIQNPKTLGLVQSFMAKQDSWVREQVKLNKSSDPLWQHAGFIVAQMDGLQAGARDWAKKQGKKPLSLFQIQFLNAVGDLLDLIPALVPSSNPHSETSNFQGWDTALRSSRSEMLPGFENLLFAHSSWYTYAATMRIYKHWDFHIAEPHAATGKLSFSSYPGFLVSLDDFYLLGSGLMMTQTTNNVFNSSLFDTITPKSLLAWQRVRLAHSLAHTGEEWAKTFSMYNSGTYNNQYMVLDRSKVKLGHSIDDGALTVVEQIPGLSLFHLKQKQFEFISVAAFLAPGYWPSYNVPFHEKIYMLSGYGEMWEEYGEDFSYDLCPRAKIFRRDQANVKDLDSLKRIMRFNDYRKDPYSKGDPCKSICCRNDLRSEGPSPGGCYDTKVTDFQMAGEFRAEAVNGPTTQDGLPPFFWDKFSSITHQGLPRYYNFTFIQMQPLLFMP
ncbi:hypothetical protein INR49_029101 [Caranx melampygus]|nr:hypothetical protein INR49_029101 [Caranx melampygus]